MSLVADAVSKLGPCTTQELGQYLIGEFHLNPDAARKRIQRARASKEILTAHFNFAHNQQFVYLKRHEHTRQLRNNLIKTIHKTNSALRYPLSGIKARGGALPKALFSTFSGLPDRGRNPTIDSALNLLLQMGFVNEDRENNELYLDSLFLNSPLDHQKIKGRLSSEQTVLAAFSDWLKLQGIISKHVDMRFGETSTQFGFHYRDLKAPCSKYPFTTGFAEDKNLGYIVADVILGRNLELTDTEYFFHKCETIRRNKRMPPFFAWLIAEHFHYDIIGKAQKHGVVCTTPGNLFGKQLAKVLKLLSELIEGKDFALSKTEDIIARLADLAEHFEHLSSMNGNLKGAMFEVMVGHWLSRNVPGSIRYGRLLKGKSDKAYDSDVLVDQPGTHLMAYECKNQPRVELIEVEHWFGTVVTAIREHYRMDEPDRYPKQEFGIWTTGRFDKPSIERLEALKASCKKYDVVWFDGEDTKKRIIALNDPKISHTYESFFKAPRHVWGDLF